MMMAALGSSELLACRLLSTSVAAALEACCCKAAMLPDQVPGLPELPQLPASPDPHQT